MTKIYNRKSETQKRKLLRNNMPKAEVILWSKLMRRQLGGFKFRRQFSVYAYVIDFYCPEIKLAIELDGESHFTEDAKEYDKNRQEFIETLGITFIRFTNNEVYTNLDGVLESILNKAKELQPPFVPPNRRGESMHPLLAKEGTKGRSQ